MTFIIYGFIKLAMVQLEPTIKVGSRSNKMRQSAWFCRPCVSNSFLLVNFIACHIESVILKNICNKEFHHACK